MGREEGGSKVVVGEMGCVGVAIWFMGKGGGSHKTGKLAHGRAHATCWHLPIGIDNAWGSTTSTTPPVQCTTILHLVQHHRKSLDEHLNQLDPRREWPSAACSERRWQEGMELFTRNE